jgi:hypothetical protein
MAGVCQGNPANVSVDANGYLHMKITNSGGTWTAAELFTTERLGFGTYQWQIDGPIDRLDPNVVVGLFPYGPNAPRTNEIDIEYAFWGHPDGVNADWVVYPASGTTVGSKSYLFSLGGATLSTSRFIWASDRVDSFLMGGLVGVGSTAGLIDSWTYTPSDPTVNIPQQTLPLGMNLWCFDAPPSNGQNVEIVVRDFQFVPEGTTVDAGSPGTGGTAGSGGTAGGGGRDGGAGRGGMAGRGGDAGGGGAAGNGGAAGSGGSGGASTSGASGNSGASGQGGMSTSASSAGGASGAASTSTAGGASISGGAGGTSGGGGTSNAGGTATAGSTHDAATDAEAGCGCRLATGTARNTPWLASLLIVVSTFLRTLRARRVRKA